MSSAAYCRSDTARTLTNVCPAGRCERARRSGVADLTGISILAVPVGTVIHQATFRVGRMCSWPILQAPDTVSGVHIAVELTGSRLVLGHFSDTSPCLCSFFVRPAP